MTKLVIDLVGVEAASGNFRCDWSWPVLGYDRATATKSNLFASNVLQPMLFQKPVLGPRRVEWDPSSGSKSMNGSPTHSERGSAIWIHPGIAHCRPQLDDWAKVPDTEPG
jgi:hypothetical protein